MTPARLQFPESDGDAAVGDPGDEDVLAVKPGRFIPLRSGMQVTAADRELVGRRHRFYRNISLHEGGHVSVGLLCGAPVAGSTMLLVDRWHCRTWFADRDGPADLSRISAPRWCHRCRSAATIAPELVHAFDQVVGLLAGPMAEALFTDVPLSRSEHDEAEARSIAGPDLPVAALDRRQD